MTDPQLLAAYAATGDHDAFAALVRRHVDLVYNACLRQTRGDRHLAEDATQAVFLLLARRAARLKPTVVLAGWLYNTARHAAANAVRSEARRRRHERKAAAAMPLTIPPPAADDLPHWDEIAPILDRAVSRLSTPDRDVVLLRYFQNKPLREVAGALGVSEEAAKKRVARAVDKLRRAFAPGGVTATAAALAACLATIPTQAAPPALTAAACNLALPAAATASVNTLANATFLLARAKSLAAAASALAATVILGGVGAAILLAAPPAAAPAPAQAAAATAPATAPTTPSPATPATVVDPAALVRDVRAAEAWIDTVKSFTATAELTWVVPPGAPADAPPVPPRTEKLVLGFDDRRLFYRTDATEYRLVNRRTWDGRVAVVHEKYSPRERNQEHYSLDEQPWDVGQFLMTHLSWPRVGPHPYWWIAPDRRNEGDDFYGGPPENFRLAGRETFRGVDCHVLESDLYYRTLHVGVADRRLYGLTNRVFPRRSDRARRTVTRQIARDMGAAVTDNQTEDAWLARLSADDRKRYDREYFKRLRPFARPQATHWYADYKEVAPGCWFPMRQGYYVWGDSPDTAEPGVKSARDIRLVHVAVNQPLPDDAFAWEFTEGVDVVDRRSDPVLQYKHKKKFTPEEWQAILDDAAQRKARRRPGSDDIQAQLRRPSPVGKPAPEFPADATWANGQPLQLADLAGKFVVVELFASWSKFSRDDVPRLNELHALSKGPASTVAVIGVHPAGTPPDAVRTWIKDHGVNYPVCIDTPGPQKGPWDGTLFTAYHVMDLPNAYVINPQGRVMFEGTPEGAITYVRRQAPEAPDGL